MCYVANALSCHQNRIAFYSCKCKWYGNYVEVLLFSETWLGQIYLPSTAAVRVNNLSKPILFICASTAPYSWQNV